MPTLYGQNIFHCSQAVWGKYLTKYSCISYHPCFHAKFPNEVNDLTNDPAKTFLFLLTICLCDQANQR